MKRISVSILSLFLLSLYAPPCHAVPYFNMRSHSANLHQIVIDDSYLSFKDHETERAYLGGYISITPEYSHSFSASKLAECLIGRDCFYDNCGTQNIVISGSRVENRGQRDWLADHFGLPTDFVSCVSIAPTIDDFLIHFNSHFNFNQWCPRGFTVSIYAPIVNARWKLNMCENVITPGELGYDAGYFTPSAIERTALLDTFTQFISGQSAPDFENDEDHIIFEPLENAKWMVPGCNKLSRTSLSDLLVTVGWNIVDKKWVGLSIGALFNAPTGLEPKGEFFFEPIIGNGGHWEFGVYLEFDASLWRNSDETREINFHMFGFADHLYNATQCRVFNLNDKCNSRYMLAEKLNKPIVNLWAEDDATITQPDRQFKNIFAPVANLTHTQVKVDAKIESAVSGLLNYIHNNFSMGVGYEFWYRSCTRIKPDCRCNTPFEGISNWALKGDSHLFGFYSDGSITNFSALSATQSNATIFSGTNNFVGPDGNDGGINGVRPTANPGIDNPQLAFANQAGSIPLLDRPVDGVNTRTSLEPIMLSACDVDIAGSQTSGLSHKVYAHFGYAITYTTDWTPYIDIGGSGEFGENKQACTTDDNGSGDTTCARCSLSKWTVWLKTGLLFD